MSLDTGSLRGELDRFLQPFDRFFPTRRSRAHFRTYVEGQIGPLERKSAGHIAEAAGVPSRTFQEFLSLSPWDEDGVRDELQDQVRRAHRGPENLLAVTETCLPKRGAETACVQRQWCGPTGKVENCVLAVSVALANPGFCTLLDASLYLPRGTWHERPEKRRRVGIPAGVHYRPWHEIALEQIGRARGHGVPIGCVTADERYGDEPALLAALEAWGLPYAVEVSGRLKGWTAPPAEGPSLPVRRIVFWEPAFRRQAWTPCQAEETGGCPGAWTTRWHAFRQDRGGVPSRELLLAIVRNGLDGACSAILVHAPHGEPLSILLRAAFARRSVERGLEVSRAEIGMGHFEVRGWRSVRRHLILSLVSQLFLAEQRERPEDAVPVCEDRRGPVGV